VLRHNNNTYFLSYEITRKDRLAKNVERMAQNKSAKMFDFIPRSFMMPSEYQDFCQHAARDKGKNGGRNLTP